MMGNRQNAPSQLAESRVFAFKTWIMRYGVLTAAFLAVMGLAVLFQFPTISQAFPGGDDSGYLFDGVRFVEQGVWMPLGSGPLAGMVNGAVYAFFPRDHMLLGQVSEIRRIILLLTIMAAIGLAAARFGGWRAALAAMAVAAIARPISTVLENSADGLYTAFSAFSFAALLWAWPRGDGQNPHSRHWLMLVGGLLMGVGALARLDGLLLGCLLIVGIWFLCGRNRIGASMAGFFAGGMAVPLLVFIFAYASVTGRWDPQFGQRSYLAFEQGHNFLYSGRYDIVPNPSSSTLYGTADENGYSVPRAILRNPRAFVSRIPLVLADAARKFYIAYSIIGGLLFLFLVAAGLAVKKRKSDLPVAFLMLIWCVPLAGYLLASYRPGFFGTVFPELLTVAMLGVIPVVTEVRALAGSANRPLLILWALIVLGVVGSQAQYVAEQMRDLSAQRHSEDAYRNWLQELESQVPQGACLISYNAAEAIYSNHAVFTRWTVFFETKSPSDLRQTMTAGDCRFLIVSPDLREAAPDFSSLAPQTLLPFYTSADSTQTIYRLP
jgi:hypothetical protein